jgi:orotate phosphoribosyltransferase
MLKVIKQNENIDVMAMLKKTKAVLEGHFKLTSGYHSGHYLQCAKLLMHPDLTLKIAEETSKMIEKSVGSKKIDLIVSPAVGGIIFGYMVAYMMGKDMIFAERKKDKMELRRGFSLKEGQRVVIAEDVITTGGSVKEVIEICRQCNAEVMAVAAIVDRSQGVDFKVPYHHLIQLKIDNFLPDDCPLCRKGLPVEIPGSRK